MGDLLARLQSALGDAYRIEKELGGGGMSRLFLATEASLHRQVVIKLLPPEFASEVSATRFRQEIEVAAHLQHTNILPVLTAGANDLLFYVMPFVSGESLRHRLTREGKLPVGDAIRILHEIADALAHAHAEGVIHRDIKPENILLLGSHAVLTDFGVARALAESPSGGRLTDTGLALGTPGYMSPEQAAGERNVDARADVYALAVVGYEMLAGFPPFAGPTAQAVIAAHLTATPKPLTDVRPEAPPNVANAIARALAKDPNARLRTAAEFRDAIATAAVGAAGQKRTLLRVVGLYALVSVAALGVAYFLTIALGLPSWVVSAAAVLLLVGFPIMLLTALAERRAMVRSTSAEFAAVRGPQSWLTWRKALAGGVLAFAALGVATVGWTLMRLLGIGPVGTLLAKGRLAEKDRLIVADFDNRTADAGLGQSLTEAFRIDLAQTRVVTLVSAGAMSEVLTRMQRDPAAPLTPGLAREVAAREGAKAVVVGEVSTVGQGFVLAARLVGAADGSELVALRETAPNDRGLVAAMERLSRRLRERIGESLRTIRAGPPLERVTTVSLPALKLYSEGVGAFNQSDYARAASLFEQAIALDSNFAMAWRKLGVSRVHLGASPDQALDALSHAYALRERLPEVERLHTAAFYDWAVTNDFDAAEAAYRQVLTLKADDQIALTNLGEIVAQRRQFAEAESLTASGIRVQPSGAGFWDLVAFQLAQGKVNPARQTLAQFGKAFPESYDYESARAWFLVGVGAYDSAQRGWVNIGLRFREPAQQADVHANLAALSQIQGKLAEAERHFHQWAAVAEQRTDPGTSVLASSLLAVGHAVLRHDSAGALRLMQAALAQHPLERIPVLARPYPALMTYAVAGRPDLARRLFTEYEASRPAEVRNFWGPYLKGHVALGERKAQDAIVAFRQAVERWSPSWVWCNACGYWELGLAYEQAGQRDSALAAYEHVANDPGTGAEVSTYLQWSFPPSLQRLGELYEARGDRAKALEYYGRFMNLWKDADPELQPIVRDVRARIARLARDR